MELKAKMLTADLLAAIFRALATLAYALTPLADQPMHLPDFPFRESAANHNQELHAE